MNLEWLAYVSRSRIDASDVSALVKLARSLNELFAISGLMLFDGQHFFQYLEGEPAFVQRLYDTIAKDERHRELRPLGRGPLPTRRFAQWSMGYLYERSLAAELEAVWLDGLPEERLEEHLQRWMRFGDIG